MRRSWVAVVAALAFLAGGTACSVTHASSAPAPSALVGATPQELAQYNSLVDQIYGTPEQRWLGEKYVYQKVQTAIWDCMAQAGLGYVAPTFQGVENQTAPGDLDVTAPLDDFSLSREVTQGAQAIEADLQAGDNPPWHAAVAKGLGDQYNKTETACSDKASAADYTLEGRPADRVAATHDFATARELFNVAVNFEQAIRTYQSTPAVQAQLSGYRSCLRGQGFFAASWLALYNQVVAKYQDLRGTPWSRLQATSGWQAAFAVEQKAEAADATCRGNLRSIAIHALHGVVETYGQNPDVAKLAASWQAIKADALRTQ